MKLAAVRCLDLIGTVARLADCHKQVEVFHPEAPKSPSAGTRPTPPRGSHKTVLVLKAALSFSYALNAKELLKLSACVASDQASLVSAWKAPFAGN